MSTRTHAPECAKKIALDEEGIESIGHTPCTCSATYEPGAISASDRELLLRLVTEARVIAGEQRSIAMCAQQCGALPEPFPWETDE